MDDIRINLALLQGQRHYFEATYIRCGRDKEQRKTVLLIDVTVGGVPVACHTWIRYEQGLRDAGELEGGDKLRFSAYVRPYTKGHGDDQRLDYELTQIRKAHILKEVN